MYYESQADACIDGGVAALVIENVEEVLREYPDHPKYGRISPVAALKKHLGEKYEKVFKGS